MYGCYAARWRASLYLCHLGNISDEGEVTKPGCGKCGVCKNHAAIMMTLLLWCVSIAGGIAEFFLVLCPLKRGARVVRQFRKTVRLGVFDIYYQRHGYLNMGTYQRVVLPIDECQRARAAFYDLKKGPEKFLITKN